MKTITRNFLKAYIEWSYYNLNLYENTVDLKDPFEVEERIFDSFLGGMVVTVYNHMNNRTTKLTNKNNVWFGMDDGIFSEIVKEVIEEYDED